MTTRHLHFLAALAVASLPSVAQAQKIGPEFQVNTLTKGYEKDADVASDAAGNLMVVWQSTGYDYGVGLFGRTYDSDGTPLTDQFQISESGVPAIASTNGNFVVVWNSSEDEGYRILGQRYDRDGNPLGGEFQINSDTVYRELHPAVASDASGNFVVVWGVSGRRFDSYGNPLSDEFFVKGSGSVASAADGNFVVVWAGFGYDYTDIFGQRYDKTGTALGDDFRVNSYTTSTQFEPSVATTSDGNFLVVWESGYYDEPGPDGSQFGVSGQLYDPAGTRVGGEFQVNQYTTCSQWNPDVTVDEDGNFVVIWQSGLNRACGQDGYGPGIYGRRYDVQGRPLTDEFQVNTVTNNNESRPSVASASSGTFVVVWESPDINYQFGYGIFGQRFSTDCQASVAVEGDVQPPGGTLRVQVHIAHHRPKTITVPWELRLLDANGQRIVRRTTEPHTFEPGDVVDRSVELRLPGDLVAGTYTLELTISGMAGTKGATTTFRVVRAE